MTCSGSPRLSYERDQTEMRDDMDRRVTPAKRVISLHGIPRLHVNRPLRHQAPDLQRRPKLMGQRRAEFLNFGLKLSKAVCIMELSFQ